ncbi:MAG: hypothetical protein IT481_16190 [Gammaproteobacteria bacterium]|nr:hypothetical protein [Gammaproteobacteria bacterium]
MRDPLPTGRLRALAVPAGRLAALAASLATLIGALLLLNAALTFHNVWPTPAIELRGEWSVEVAALLLALAAWVRRRGPLSRGALTALGGLLLLFVLARYAEVTAPALYGRGVNLYWDARHVGGAVAMLVAVVPAWQIGAALALLFAALATGLALLRACVARLARALDPAAGAGVDRVARPLLVGGAALALLLFGFERAAGPLPAALARFSIPVTQTWGRQFALLGGSWLVTRTAAATAGGPAAAAVAGASADGTAAGGAMAKARALAAAAVAGMGTDAAAVDGGGAVAMPALHRAAGQPREDVFVVFVESYGAIAWQRADVAARLVESRAALAQAIERSGRAVVSAWVRSPTFGSGSWLAHASLLTGTEVRDGDGYARLLLRPRTTLTDVFRRDGYRVLALMPGLKQAWPEGEYFRFDAVYGADALDYRGPAFGWWRIPDQYALAGLDALEAARRVAGPRPPAFVFFPTISSHLPFRPTPPYQPDWSRLDGATPYGPEAERAIAQAPEWTRLGPAYGDSLAYAQRTLAGYLERRAGEPLLMLMLGDHQPPAAVSGEGASHDVPVHVVGDRPEVLEALCALGFVPGLDPAGAPIGSMHELGPLLVAALAAAPRSPPPAMHAARTGGGPQGLAVAPVTLPN